VILAPDQASGGLGRLLRIFTLAGYCGAQGEPVDPVESVRLHPTTITLRG